jgi:hypothetical protein
MIPDYTHLDGTLVKTAHPRAKMLLAQGGLAISSYDLSRGVGNGRGLRRDQIGSTADKPV